MGLIALVSNFPARTVQEKRGDIIVVKLEDSPWGVCEVKEFVRIFLADADLEAVLVAKRAAGQTHPQIAYPYQENEITEEDVGGGRMRKTYTRVKRSDRQFDIDWISAACIARTGKTKAEILDTKTEIPVLKAGEVNYKFKLTREVSIG